MTKNFVKNGKIVRIFDELPEITEKLAPGTYKMCFQKMMGYYLEETEDFTVKESKIYGNTSTRIQKVLGTFEQFDRSMGVILSGDKGMGKSLFMQLLSIQSIEKELPVIIIDQPFPGLVDFLEDIEQEVIVVFDEFEKIFSKERGENGISQEEMLGLFDGVSQKKKLYIVTVNNTHRLSDFLLNRPGRFHYHMKFEYPTIEEITEYMNDKVLPEYRNQIGQIVSYAVRTTLNYDSLRAIAFEVNMGVPFTECIEDLNIKKAERTAFDITVTTEDGKSFKSSEYLNLFEPEVDFGIYVGNEISLSISFRSGNLITGEFGKLSVVEGIKQEIRYDGNDYTDEDGNDLPEEEIKRVVPPVITSVKLEKSYKKEATNYGDVLGA